MLTAAEMLMGLADEACDWEWGVDLLVVADMAEEEGLQDLADNIRVVDWRQYTPRKPGERVKAGALGSLHCWFNAETEEDEDIYLPLKLHRLLKASRRPDSFCGRYYETRTAAYQALFEAVVALSQETNSVAST